MDKPTDNNLYIQHTASKPWSDQHAETHPGINQHTVTNPGIDHDRVTNPGIDQNTATNAGIDQYAVTDLWTTQSVEHTLHPQEHVLLCSMIEMYLIYPPLP